jgi:anti-anti-sigma factor
MTVDTKISTDEKKVTISVIGKFDFKLYNAFRSAYSGTNGFGVEYLVDFSKADYLDSSALGMLLLLREHAGGGVSDITILHASGDVKKALDVANFEKLFKI